MRIDCEIYGLDDLAEMIEQYQLNAQEVYEDMLVAGAKEIKACWKRAADKHGLKDTGEMIAAISYRLDRQKLNAYIYPRGNSTRTTFDGRSITRKKPVRHATKAFILHYGTKRFAATYWVDTAMDEADETVPQILYKRWSDFIEKGR